MTMPGIINSRRRRFENNSFALLLPINDHENINQVIGAEGITFCNNWVDHLVLRVYLWKS